MVIAEVIHRRDPWRNREAIEYATLEWVDWFNNRRLFEPIRNIPPAEADAEGCIGVIGADQDYVVAFDEVGIEKLKRLIAEHKAGSRPGRSDLDG